MLGLPCSPNALYPSNWRSTGNGKRLPFARGSLAALGACAGVRLMGTLVSSRCSRAEAPQQMGPLALF